MSTHTERPICPASGTPAQRDWWINNERRVYCPTCGKLVSVTTWGYIRKHVDALA